MLEVMDFGLDSRFLEDWEALTEGRIFALTDLDERRAGALTAAYRYFGENLKRGRLQLHRLLGGPHGPLVRPPRLLLQHPRHLLGRGAATKKIGVRAVRA